MLQIVDLVAAGAVALALALGGLATKRLRVPAVFLMAALAAAVAVAEAVTPGPTDAGWHSTATLAVLLMGAAALRSAVATSPPVDAPQGPDEAGAPASDEGSKRT